MAYRPPIAWDALLGFIAARAARGVETVRDGEYARTVRAGNLTGLVRARLGSATGEPTIQVELSESLVPSSDAVVERLTDLFDATADPSVIDSHLAEHGLRENVGRAAGVRVPGAFDGFELAVRAVLGQQVTVKGASTLMARLTAAFGEPIETGDSELTHLTATADRIAGAGVLEIREIGLPNARAATLHALATRVARGDISFERRVDIDEFRSKLLGLPGFGPWTVDYVAMRVARWSDAFPASDVAFRHALGDVSPAEIARISTRWRPWRAYAAMRLWLFGRQ